MFVCFAGIGDPAYFYIDLIFVENGALMSLIFILATYLSDSLMGGIIAVLTFFYNHGEASNRHNIQTQEQSLNLETKMLGHINLIVCLK